MLIVEERQTPGKCSYKVDACLEIVFINIIKVKVLLFVRTLGIKSLLLLLFPSQDFMPDAY